jgi:hypothetical protein
MTAKYVKVFEFELRFKCVITLLRSPVLSAREYIEKGVHLSIHEEIKLGVDENKIVLVKVINADTSLLLAGSIKRPFARISMTLAITAVAVLSLIHTLTLREFDDE